MLTDKWRIRQQQSESVTSSSNFQWNCFFSEFPSEWWPDNWIYYFCFSLTRSPHHKAPGIHLQFTILNHMDCRLLALPQIDPFLSFFPRIVIYSVSAGRTPSSHWPIWTREPIFSWFIWLRALVRASLRCAGRSRTVRQHKNKKLPTVTKEGSMNVACIYRILFHF